MLCINKANRCILIFECNVFSFLKPILCLFNKEIKKTISNSNQPKVDHIRFLCKTANKSGIFKCGFSLIDQRKNFLNVDVVSGHFSFENNVILSEDVIESCTISYACLPYILILNSLHRGIIYLIEKKLEHVFVPHDVVKEIFSSFDVEKEFVEIPHTVPIMKLCFVDNLIFRSVCLLGIHIFFFNFEKMGYDEIISLIKSLLEYFMFFMNKLTPKKIRFLIGLMLGVLNECSNLPEDYFDVIRTYFETTGWVEWLITFFRDLNQLLSSAFSSKCVPFYISEFISLDPNDIYTSVSKGTKIIRLLCGEDTPNDIKEFITLDPCSL
jgi:hypothetical protein